MFRRSQQQQVSSVTTKQSVKNLNLEKVKNKENFCMQTDIVFSSGLRNNEHRDNDGENKGQSMETQKD